MRRPRKAINQMNVVPYIDVMLVLLVIFMVTAPLIAPGEIELPRVGEAPSKPKQPLEITVRSDGSYWLRNRTNPNLPLREYSANALVLQLADAQKENPDQAVVIAGDKSTRYENIVKLLDLLQRNQIKHVGLLVVPDQTNAKR